MALEEKRNNVKYQGRDDYEVVYYDVPETGKKYFFLDGGNQRLKNGNIIATTNLKVAIDANKPEELADIGVVSPEGQEVIPFNHRKIRMINDDLLLAELVNPTSENVIKAIEDRGQPQEATRLVSAANVIKEKINNGMGPEGKFIFNDLFSEATIYDIDGNNMANGEYYSFIGVNNDSLFLSKNDPETEIIDLPLKDKVEEEVVQEEVTEAVEPETLDAPVDVSEVSVAENVVEDAFNNENVEAPKEEVAEEETVEAVEEPVQEEVVEEETETLEDNAQDVDSKEIDIPTPEDIVGEMVEEPVSEEETVEAVEEPVQEEAVEEQEESVEDTVSEELSIPNVEVEPEAKEEEVVNIPKVEEEEEDIYNFDNSQVKVDSIDDYENFDSLVEENHFDDSDIAEGTAILEEMINGIKDRDREISKLKSQVADQRELNKAIVKKSRDLEEKITEISRDNTRLEEVNNYYKRAANTLAEENHNLKAQLEDKDKLLDMLKEAKRLLNGDEPRYDFDDENNFRMIA